MHGSKQQTDDMRIAEAVKAIRKAIETACHEGNWYGEIRAKVTLHNGEIVEYTVSPEQRVRFQCGTR
jgi:hypothetical protein